MAADAGALVPRSRDLALEVPLAAVAFAGVVFFAGVHRWFIAGHFLVALLLAGFHCARAAATGTLRLAFPVFGAVPLAVVAYGYYQARSGTSVAPDETRETLLRYGAATIVFFLAACAARSEETVRRAGFAVAGLVAFEVLYGIAEHVGGREYILLWPKAYPGNVSGTYNNRDHFAGMLVLAAPFLLGLAQSEPWRWQASAPRFATRLGLALDQPGFWRAGAFFAAAALAGLGVLASLSRGGALALVFALLVYGALATSGRGSTRRAQLLATGGLVTLVLLAGLLYGSTDPLLRRFAAMREQTRGQVSRLAFAKGTLELIAERPLSGAGLGTFERSFTHVQKAWFQSRYLEHAHCDWLQLPCEVGIPLAAAAAALLALSCLSAIRGAGGERSVTNGLAAAVAGAGAHALVDFSLQREGNLVFAAFLLGLLLGPRAPRAVLLGRSARVLGPLLALALAPFVPYPWTVFRAELLAMPTVRPEDDARSPAEKLEDLEAAIALRPDHSAYRRLAVEARLDAFARSLEDDARASARALAGDPPPEELVQRLRVSLAASRADAAAGVTSACIEDLRAAAASDPANARVLSLLALVTLDGPEAKRVGDAAVAAYPFGADVLIEVGLGRSKCDRQDAEAASLLARGLALDPSLTAYAGFYATTFGLERELSRALPDAAARKEWARRLLARRERALLGEELDAIARTEEASALPARPGTTGEARTLAILRPEEWLEKPGGLPLERLGALVLRLGRKRAGHLLTAGGTLLLETSLVPGHEPVWLCVLHGGKHVGHLLVAGDWTTERFAIPGAGWLEIEPSLERHALASGEPDDGVLVRDAALVSAP